MPKLSFSWPGPTLAGVRSTVPPATGHWDASQVERDKPLAALSDCPGRPPFPSGRNCPLCLSWDHTRTDCALASLFPQSTDSKRTTGQQRLYWVPGEYCRRFNSGSYPNSSEACRFLHACSTCGKLGHPASECKEPKVKNKAPTARGAASLVCILKQYLITYVII